MPVYRSVELLTAPELAAHLQRRGSDSGSYRPGGSGDGTADEDEETDATGGGGERRGSNPQEHNSRRGSRANTAAADKKKGDKKRRRDKQGAGQSCVDQALFLSTWLGTHASIMSRDVPDIHGDRADFCQWRYRGCHFYRFVFWRKTGLLAFQAGRLKKPFKKPKKSKRHLFGKTNR